MFERFSAPGRLAIVLAQEESRALGHDHIGVEHLLLGALRVDPGLLDLGVAELRTRLGTGPGAVSDQVPFTPAAKRALERALRLALDEGMTIIGPRQLLVALVEEPEVVACTGLDTATLRAQALGPPSRAGAAPPVAPDPGEPERWAQAWRDRWARIAAVADAGGPLPVWVEERLALGDLGNLVVDVHLLLAMLRLEGRSAALLREHGLDEAALRALLPFR